MARPTHLPLVLSTTSALLIATACTAFAAWPPNGKPLTRAAGVQDSPAAVTDGANGAIVVWNDARTDAPGVYGTRVTAKGRFVPGWTADGTRLAGAPVATPPITVPDGQGGAFVVWSRGNSGHAVQHVNANGSLAPGWPADGLTLVTSPPVGMPMGGPSGLLLSAIDDGAGGFYLMWNTFDGSRETLWLQRFDGNGTAVSGWSSPVLVGIAGMGGARFTLTRLLEGANGAIVATSVAGDLGIGTFVDGSVVFATSGGAIESVLLGPGSLLGDSFLGITEACADGAGGVFVAYEPSVGSGRNILHLDATRQSVWPTSATVPAAATMLDDGSGGMIAFSRTLGVTGLSAWRLDASGSLASGWAATGLPLTSAYIDGGLAARRAAGGTMVVWSQNGGAAGNDVYATVFGDDGALAAGWPANGAALCTARRFQTQPTLAVLADGRAIAAWQDTRRRNETDIFARIVQPAIAPAELEADETDGDVAALPIGANRRLGAPEPEPLSIAVTSRGPVAEARIHSGAAGDARIEVLDVGGRVIARGTAPAADAVLAIPMAGAPRGLYWARVRQGSRTASVKFVHAY